MKIVRLLLVVSFCCNTMMYGMEYRSNKSIPQRLSDANELMDRAEKIFEINQAVAYTAGFRTVSSPVKERHQESVTFTNKANSLVQPIMKRQVLSLQDAADAQRCLNRINTLLTKITNVKK